MLLHWRPTAKSSDETMRRDTLSYQCCLVCGVIIFRISGNKIQAPTHPDEEFARSLQHSSQSVKVACVLNKAHERDLVDVVHYY